jgi:hypothetical protein
MNVAKRNTYPNSRSRSRRDARMQQRQLTDGLTEKQAGCRESNDGFWRRSERRSSFFFDVFDCGVGRTGEEEEVKSVWRFQRRNDAADQQLKTSNNGRARAVAVEGRLTYGGGRVCAGGPRPGQARRMDGWMDGWRCFGWWKCQTGRLTGGRCFVCVLSSRRFVVVAAAWVRRRSLAGQHSIEVFIFCQRNVGAAWNAEASASSPNQGRQRQKPARLSRSTRERRNRLGPMQEAACVHPPPPSLHPQHRSPSVSAPLRAGERQRGKGGVGAPARDARRQPASTHVSTLSPRTWIDATAGLGSRRKSRSTTDCSGSAR